MRIIELNHQDVLNILPDRCAESHKGDYGRVLLLCGSVGFTGAAALAAMGALRSGAGLVYVGVPQSIYEIEAVKLTEPIVFPYRILTASFQKRLFLKFWICCRKWMRFLLVPVLAGERACFLL